MNIKNLISDIIAEAALDSRIDDGIVDLKNTNHLQIVAEKMYDTVLDEQIVNEFVKNFVDEGKYPERQAYNKEGWLVTFPSKEYRDAAVKRGSHAISDPTHGKGGMNLYYRRKGKQRRQTQQGTSTIAATQATQAPAQPAAPTRTSQPATPKTNGASQPSTAPVAPSAETPTVSPEKTPTTAPEKPATKPVTSTADTVSATAEPKSDSIEAPSRAETPAIDVPVVTTPPEQYSNISKKFAEKKNWKAEPYGEYKDIEGNSVAVVGLSGEVVPIKNTDREEYKLFAEKSRT